MKLNSLIQDMITSTNQSILTFQLGFSCSLLMSMPTSRFMWELMPNQLQSVFGITLVLEQLHESWESRWVIVNEGRGNFSREFQYLKVHVNIKTQEGKLTVKGGKEEL